MPGYQFDWGTPSFAGPDATGFQGVSGAPAIPAIGDFGQMGGSTAVAPAFLGSSTPYGGITTGGGGFGSNINQNVFGGKLGANMGTAQLALSGLGTLGGLWGAFQAASLAKKQFNYTKDVTETNMANQLKTFNTGLTDRANNRAIVEGRTPAETQAYIDTNKLTRYGR